MKALISILSIKILCFSVGIMLSFLFNTGNCFAQAKQIITAWNSYKKRWPMEKVYLHTDKPYYSLGDTLWYKSYLLNRDYLNAATRSSLLYVELISDSGIIVKRQLIRINSGAGLGNIALDDTTFKEGAYTLRAYTNWMRNFGQASFFTKKVEIHNLASSRWLVKYATVLNGDLFSSHLVFTKFNGESLILRDMDVKLFRNGKKVYQAKSSTRFDGKLDVNFKLPDKTEKLKLQIVDLGPGDLNPVLEIPLIVQRPENIDLQFFPEGSNLVNGLPSRIAFKAIGEDGKSVEVAGKVYDNKGQEIAAFESSHLGMGSFEMTPRYGESYTAKLALPAGSIKVYNLPDVKHYGTTLKIRDSTANDSLKVIFSATKDISGSSTYYLVGQSRNLICYAAAINLKNSIPVSLNVPKSAFPSGISRFTLVNAEMQPLNERLFYIDHEDNLKITIKPTLKQYKPYDSIALAIQVEDYQHKPVQGTFSISVTHDGQVKADLMNNMITYNFINSELNGYVENPAFYFNDKLIKVKEMDELLLTQGWIGYDWKDVFTNKTTAPTFKAETDYSIRGKVTNILKRPIAKSEVTLISKKPFLALNTLTNIQGVFAFENLNPADTALYFIQAKNRSGNSMNIGIEMDESSPPPAAFSTNSFKPWYLNTDTLELNYAKTRMLDTKNQILLRSKGILLNEVVIQAKKIIPGSLNLNGPGEADMVIDKKELEKAGKMSLGDLLKKRIKGFRIGEFPLYYNTPLTHKLTRIRSNDPRRKLCYLIVDKQMRLVIDGYDVDDTYREMDPRSPTERLNYIKSYLDYYSAEDIKGIELMWSKKYNTIYHEKVLNGANRDTLLNVFSDIAYLEITSRSGNGPFMRYTPGTYLYKPLSFSQTKQFYTPRYTIKEKDKMPDLRSTIYWNPIIITDANGKANISFFGNSVPGNYTISLEGTDMNGNIGSVREYLTVGSIK